MSGKTISSLVIGAALAAGLQVAEAAPASPHVCEFNKQKNTLVIRDTKSGAIRGELTGMGTVQGNGLTGAGELYTKQGQKTKTYGLEFKADFDKRICATRHADDPLMVKPSVYATMGPSLQNFQATAAVHVIPQRESPLSRIGMSGAPSKSDQVCGFSRKGELQIRSSWNDTIIATLDKPISMENGTVSGRGYLGTEPGKNPVTFTANFNNRVCNATKDDGSLVGYGVMPRNIQGVVGIQIPQVP